MTLDFAQVANGKPNITKKEKAMAALTVPQIGPIQLEFNKYAPKLTELEKQAKALKVIDNETFQISIDGAGTAKGLVKAIDGRRAEVIAPFREYINKVNNAAKFFTDPFKRIADEFSRKGGDYQYQLQLAEKKRQKAIDEANRALQEKLNKQAKEDGVEEVTVLPVKAPKPESVIHTAGGHSQHLRKQWVGEIKEPTKIPYEYCSPDQTKINMAIRQGVREIKGVKIYEKVSAVHR